MKSEKHKAVNKEAEIQNNQFQKAKNYKKIYTAAIKEQYLQPLYPSVAFVAHKFGMKPHKWISSQLVPLIHVIIQNLELQRSLLENDHPLQIWDESGEYIHKLPQIEQNI